MTEWRLESLEDANFGRGAEIDSDTKSSSAGKKRKRGEKETTEPAEGASSLAEVPNDDPTTAPLLLLLKTCF